MFIRWRARPVRTVLGYLDCKHRSRRKRRALAATLARTERRDGKIRQRVVGAVGFAIRSCCLQDSQVRAHFWQNALRDLDQLKIDGLPRVRAVLQLAKVVRPPSEAEWGMYERHRQRTANAVTANAEVPIEQNTADAKHCGAPDTANRQTQPSPTCPAPSHRTTATLCDTTGEFGRLAEGATKGFLQKASTMRLCSMRRGFKTPVAPLPRCGAKAKSTGLPCRRYVLRGTNRCIVHGSGTRRRVNLGKRKPSGRPPTHGKRRDPTRTHYHSLGLLYDVWCDLNQVPNLLKPPAERGVIPENITRRELDERIAIIKRLTSRNDRG